MLNPHHKGKSPKQAVLYIGGRPIKFKGYDLIAIAKDRLAKMEIDAGNVMFVGTTFVPVYSFHNSLGVCVAEMVVLAEAL